MVPFNLSEPDEYFSFLAELSQIQRSIGEADLPRSEGFVVSLWIPSARASRVASEVAQLDDDARRVAAWQPRLSPGRPRRPPFFIEDLFDLGLVGGPLILAPLSEPIRPAEGGLEVTRAERGASVDIDFEAVGLVLGMFTDVPTLFMWARMMLRRVPVRITLREQNGTEDQGRTSGARIEAHHGAYDAAAIEAGRILRRIRIKYPDGSELVQEDFVPPDDEAA